ncbi:MAG: GDP-mannose 4,6-dehydratase [Thermoleophilaceae bacterium]|nr:GDP-mannose 4,6-dehydratase [Thermoleophilaceae bacterium]
MSGWSGRSVLVTGGQGFIGSWLVERLLDEGARVVVLRRDAHLFSLFRLHRLEERCDVADCNLLDYEQVLRVLNEHDVDTVFHLAAQTQVETANRSPLSTFESNIRGTYTLLEACRAVGSARGRVLRVVVASSDKAYGSHDELPYREDAPLVPRFPYDVSKAATDMIARSYAYTYRVPVAVTRLANVYGGGDCNFARLVPGAARALMWDERPVLRSDGTPERDFIYVADAVEAYLAVAESLEREELWGRAWNAGAGEPHSALEVVRRLIAAAGRDLEPEIYGDGTPHGEIDRQYLDSTAIRAELGWAPRWDLDRGLAETWAWYERHLEA